MKKSDFKGIWITVYHSPNTSDSEFIMRLEVVSESYIVSNKQTFVVGDFNFDFKDTSQERSKTEVLRIMRGFYLEQKVRSHTRVTQTSSTLIQPVFTNKKSRVKVSVIQSNLIADHKTIQLEKSRR